MKDTAAEFHRWLLEHKDLFTPYQERHGVLLAVDVANAKVAFEDADTNRFIGKMKEAEQGNIILQTVSVDFLREAGVLPNRRVEVGLPAAVPAREVMGKPAHAVILDDSGFLREEVGTLSRIEVLVNGKRMIGVTVTAAPKTPEETLDMLTALFDGATSVPDSDLA